MPGFTYELGNHVTSAVELPALKTVGSEAAVSRYTVVLCLQSVIPEVFVLSC